MKTFDYLIAGHYDELGTLFGLIIMTFIIGVIAGWFLHHFIKKDRKGEKPSFKFFHKDKLYIFSDALILLEWYHGDESQYKTYLTRFPDGLFFKIEFNDFGLDTEVEEYSKEKMIKELKDMVKSFPAKSLAALKLIED